MNIAVIGGGITGLTAAYELSKAGQRVSVFEKESSLGGLAGGFRQPNWEWPLEYSYHHFFTGDGVLLSLFRELELETKILIQRPVTATLVAGTGSSSTGLRAGKGQETENTYTDQSVQTNIFQLDSPINLFTLPFLSFADKIRTAALLGFCKLNPFWQPLEHVTAKRFFSAIGGSAGWRMLWAPLLIGKFHTYADAVPASWLWARIYKRTPNLGYLSGGFRTLIDALAEGIRKNGGHIYKNTEVTRIKRQLSEKNHFKFQISNFKFDTVLLTVPSSTATDLCQFPDSYRRHLRSIPHLFAQILILETKQPILDKIYWLNISDRSFPFIAVVAHTNFMDKTYYGGNHITYIGNYLPAGHPFLTMDKNQLLKKFEPFLKKINPEFSRHSSLITHHSYAVANAQPAHTLNYSQKAPGLETPIPGLFLANLDSIYPWDRGTNYAVELGEKAKERLLKFHK